MMTSHTSFRRFVTITLSDLHMRIILNIVYDIRVFTYWGKKDFRESRDYLLLFLSVNIVAKMQGCPRIPSGERHDAS
jgi:hypothetical protein